jgi:hypothetical protein
MMKKMGKECHSCSLHLRVARFLYHVTAPGSTWTLPSRRISCRFVRCAALVRIGNWL